MRFAHISELAKRPPNFGAFSVSEFAKRLWNDDLELFLGEKPDFSGDFQRPNLTMRENLG